MVGYISLFVSILFQLTPIQEPIQLQRLPSLVVTELDFGEDVITFCMHEGVKIKFKLALDEFSTDEVKVEIAIGDVDLRVSDKTDNIYLINPRMEAFEVNVWVKLEDVRNIHVPVVNGKIAEHDELGAFKMVNTVWKPIEDFFQTEGGYVKVISNWKLYGRTCE